MKKQTFAVIIQALARFPVASVSLLCIFFTGCCTTEVWQETGRSRVYIEDAEIIRSNDFVRAIKIKGWECSKTLPWSSRKQSEDIIEITQVQIVEKRIIPLCRLAKKTQPMNVGKHLMPVSRQEWEDDERMRGRITDTDDKGLVVLISDLNSGRKYLAVPTQPNEFSDENSDLTFSVLESPWINYTENYYVKEEAAGTVCLRRAILLPFAITCDVITFPVQFIFGLFVHM
jgi:hypothetical protein